MENRRNRAKVAAYREAGGPPRPKNRVIKRMLWIILLLEIVCAVELYMLIKICAGNTEEDRSKDALGENWFEDIMYEMSGRGKEETCIKMTGLSQESIPTGCESVSTVMVLNYLGVEIEPETFIDNYLPCGAFYRQGETVYGPDPHQVFAGNPYEKNSLGCFPQVIIKALENMQGCHYPSMDSIVVQDVSGARLEKLASKYIANDIPVLLWVTMGMEPSYEGMKYYLADGSLYTWRAGEHCMVLCGYDETTYYLMDPLTDGRKVGFPKEIVEARYEEMGKYAVVMIKR